jgi:hypothetical protein
MLLPSTFAFGNHPHPIYGDAIVVTGEQGQHLYSCLRPECVQAASIPLSSDAFTRFATPGPESEGDNQAVRAETSTMLQVRLPALATRITAGDPSVIFQSTSEIAPLLHRHGINVRHIGLLRVLLGNGDPELNLGNHHSTRLSDIELQRTRSARGTLLVEMVTRVAKQLIREALRRLANNPVDATHPSETRRRVVGQWLNQLLEPRGAWAPDTLSKPRSSDGLPDNDNNNDWLWTTVMPMHIQLKFGSQV